MTNCLNACIASLCNRLAHRYARHPYRSKMPKSRCWPEYPCGNTTSALIPPRSTSRGLKVMGKGQAALKVLENFQEVVREQTFSTILADPPWQFINRTGKVAPEHRRLSRYSTMTVDEICSLPLAKHLRTPAHLYLWVPNALLPEGLQVMKAWGFQYKSNIVWHKIVTGAKPRAVRLVRCAV